MALEKDQIHIFFLPYLAPGHMIPIMDMARLFATHGLKSTIVATPRNKPFFAETIDTANQELNTKINLITIEFPYEEAKKKQPTKTGENIYSSNTLPDFFKAIQLMQRPFEELLEEYHPNCLVADVQFTWVNSSAQMFGIPCLAFHGSSYLTQCVFSNLHIHQPQKKVSSDSEPFIVPDLPHEIKLTRSELAAEDKQETSNWLTELLNQIREVEKSSYGVIMNSFYELESDYADYYGNTLGIRHWHIGPLSLYFKARQNRTDHKEKKSSVSVNDCMKWLDEKEPNSVIYVSFGSMSHVPDAQLKGVAIALESLGQNFILVLKEEDRNEWMPDRFEERIKGQGLIIRGWAPQQQILDHPALGGFVTHCGWNSILEGITSGVPMVTWPRHAEQFYAEKLVTVVLKIGVPIGVKKWVSVYGDENEDIVGKEEITRAISNVMIGKEAEEMRKRTKELKEMAKRAIVEGGSSHRSMSELIEAVKSFKMRN